MLFNLNVVENDAFGKVTFQYCSKLPSINSYQQIIQQNKRFF